MTMRARWQQLRGLVGRRGACLLVLTFVDLAYASTLAWPTNPDRMAHTVLWIGDIAPLWFWALIWAGVGLICFAQAFTRDDRLAYSSAVLIKVMWALLFIGAAIDGVSGAIAPMVYWAAFACGVLVISTWPEFPHQPDPTS